MLMKMPCYYILLMHVYAQNLFLSDTDYIVNNKQVIIIDENTGEPCLEDAGQMVIIKP